MNPASISTTGESARLTECPYCVEPLALESIHICAIECCYVPEGGPSRKVVCPYCDATFETSVGHACPLLITLSEPAQ